MLATALGALLAWPFSAVLGWGNGRGSGQGFLHPHTLATSLLPCSVPIALDVVLLQRRLPGFLGWSVASLALILGPVVAIDYHYYGRILCTPLNIVLYNVFGGRGPELYGTEPWSYYLLNGALNFNVLFPVALAAPLLALVKVGSGGWGSVGANGVCGCLAVWCVSACAGRDEWVDQLEQKWT